MFEQNRPWGKDQSGAENQTNRFDWPKHEEDQIRAESAREEYRNPISGYIWAIIVNAGLLYVFNNLLAWKVPYLASNFIASLWILNISIGAVIFANLLFIIYDAGWFKYLLKIILNGINFTFIYTLYTTFPFDFSGLSRDLPTIIKYGLIVSMAVTGLAILVQIFRLLTNNTEDY